MASIALLTKLYNGFGTAFALYNSYPYLLGIGDDQPQVYVARQATNENGEDESSQIWNKSVPTRVSVNPVAEVMQHPLEDGSSITDHRVVLPTEVVVTLFLQKNDYRDVYQAIKEFSRGNELATIYTRADSYPNMALVSYPHEEDPETYDALTLEVTFREVVFVKPAQGTMTPEKTRNKADSSTIKQGEKTTNVTAVNTNAQQEVMEKGIKGGPH